MHGKVDLAESSFTEYLANAIEVNRRVRCLASLSITHPNQLDELADGLGARRETGDAGRLLCNEAIRRHRVRRSS